ncbi:Biotin--protein ligase [Zalerion maritima]|uniref:Biotin--protein ligase n=1 Tax=Zalerion maritima TaxID=339359 RepID=A0AAD5RLS1_9PEZI|nr:Biotin--protein ligase [Zalerion maritima]
MSAPIQKLNVLIYSGPGASATCISQATHTLRALLSPDYAVGPISLQTILKEPWQVACALLVFPGGADNPYCDALGGSTGGIRKIADYVRKGGKYLGLCAGGYFGSGWCEFEVGNPVLEVVGRRDLQFFPGTCRGGAFKGFQYASEAGARAARIKPDKTAFEKQDIVPEDLRCYCNGGGVFVDAAGMKDSGIEVLASYEDSIDVDGGNGKAAVLHCKVGNGAAVVMGPHPEFSAALLPQQPHIPHYDSLLKALEEDDEKRLNFLGVCLAKLSLTVNFEPRQAPALTELHLSSLECTTVDELLEALSEISDKDGNGLEIINSENDSFRFIKSVDTFSTSSLQESLPSTDGQRSKQSGNRPRDVIPHESSYPKKSTTPNFDHDLYYESLKMYRSREPHAKTWGSPLLYADVLTSTNTLMDKNPTFLSKLPSGFTVCATTQTSGRGRGNNVWVSPKGCLIFSSVINHPAHLAMSRPIVFIQYLAAIAVAEAVKTYAPNSVYGAIPVKLKWPNDIYARNPDWEDAEGAKQEYVKIGGILSSCSYYKGTYQIVLGIGLNTTNEKPTTSVNALLENIGRATDGGKRDPRATNVQLRSAGLEAFTIERLTARILTRLEALYKRFCDVGFSRDLEERYYAHWLHNGQEVWVDSGTTGTVPAVGTSAGPMRAKVEGITTDWGMLKVRELDADGRPINRTWALQSDENSFDYWKGLIRRRV